MTKTHRAVKTVATLGMLSAVAFAATLLSKVFPQVQGFLSFDLKDAVIAAQYNDCESGPQALEITETEEKALRRLAAEGRVTGKANATTTTGGTVSIVFRDPEGQYLCSFELYHGLLVRSDGMYTIE